MKQDRRFFLRLIASGALGATLDVDKLLWIPGQKKIFLPPLPRLNILSNVEIVAMELERILPHMKSLFERDDIFYRTISEMRLPLEIRPGGFQFGEDE